MVNFFRTQVSAKLFWSLAALITVISFQNCEQTGQISVGSTVGANTLGTTPGSTTDTANAGGDSGGTGVGAMGTTGTGGTGAGGVEGNGLPGLGGSPGVGNSGSGAPGVTVPGLQATPNTTSVPDGGSATITVTPTGVDHVTYQCTADGQVVSTGTVNLSTPTVNVTVSRDLICIVTGTNTQNPTVVVDIALNLDVNCGNRVKVGGKCRDFTCQSVREISLGNLNDIPARNSDGICYAARLVSAVSKGSSTLTGTVDSEVVSRDHNQTSPRVNRNPYDLGHFKGEVKLTGPRVVKLSGGLSATAPILVDNFILTGIYQTGANLANLNDFYRVRGTSDSSIATAGGADTHSISFLNQLIPIEAFATGGTSSIAPIEITNSIAPNTYYTLDIRALDCGGIREASNIYILFQ